MAIDLADSPHPVELITPPAGPFDTPFWDVTEDAPTNYDGPKFAPSLASEATVEVLNGTDCFETAADEGFACGEQREINRNADGNSMVWHRRRAGAHHSPLRLRATTRRSQCAAQGCRLRPHALTAGAHRCRAHPTSLRHDPRGWRSNTLSTCTRVILSSALLIGANARQRGDGAGYLVKVGGRNEIR